MKTISHWCNAVLDQVRFWPDHKAIEQELRAHYIDHVRDLERIGFDNRLAEQRALQAMGSPVEVGKAMNRAHRPWLGWLWIASITMLLFVVVWCGVDLRNSEIFARTRNSLFPAEDVGKYDAFASAYHEIYDHMGTLTAEDTLQFGEYTVSLIKGDWWYCNDQYYRAECLFRIEENGLWFDMPGQVMDDFRMFSSTGRELTNSKESGSYRERKDYTEEMSKHWFSINAATIAVPVPGKPDTARAKSSDDLQGGYLTMMMTTYEQPEWTELSYPFAGNDDVLRIDWEVAP